MVEQSYDLSTRKTSYPLISDNLAKVVMPARLRLSWVMKTLKLFLLWVLGSLEFGWQAIRYALIFVSAFFRQRASLGCEMVAMRSQLTFYRESIRQQRQPRLRNHLEVSWAMDFFTVPMATWTLQLREAIPSDHSYRFLLHDRDTVFSAEVDQQLKAF